MEKRAYCAACNASFDAARTSGRCPRCGQARVPETSPFEATRILRGDSTGEDSNAPEISAPAAENELAHLVGRQISVYRLEGVLGKGGMGSVFLGWHQPLQRKCAVKVLLPRARSDPDFLQRFFQEGRAAASLIHPNIVTTHAIGDEGEHYYLEMEFVPGRSMQRLLQDEGRLDPVRATNLIARIAEGLSAAHAGGIVHRDLKLDNVLLTLQGIPKIADFGLAKQVATAGGVVPERLAGTPNYMAPELFAGEPATPASDVYALGVCYYLLLTGRHPFSAEMLPDLIRKVCEDPVPSVRDLNPNVPLEMAECVSLMLAKAPANRPQNGIEAAQLLNAVAGTLRDIDSLLQEAFGDARDVIWRRDGERFQIALSLPDGRKQSLFVEPSSHAVSDRLLLIYSICCDAAPAYYEAALRLNSEIPHGSLAVRDVDGRPKFVMVDTYPRATVDSEEIRRSVLEVASRADAIEKLLTGLDLH